MEGYRHSVFGVLEDAERGLQRHGWTGQAFNNAEAMALSLACVRCIMTILEFDGGVMR